MTAYVFSDDSRAFAEHIKEDLKLIWKDAKVSSAEEPYLRIEGCGDKIIEPKYHTDPRPKDLIPAIEASVMPSAHWMLIIGRKTSKPLPTVVIHPFRPSDAQLRLEPKQITLWNTTQLLRSHKLRCVLWRGKRYIIWRWEAWLHHYAPIGVHAALFAPRPRFVAPSRLPKPEGSVEPSSESVLVA